MRRIGLSSAVICALFVLPDTTLADPNRKMHTEGRAGGVQPSSTLRSAAGAQPIRVDSDFQRQFGLLVPQAFTLHLPDAGLGQVNAAYPDTIDGAYLRISFSTLADGLVEALDVIPLRIAAGEAGERRQIMTRLFVTRVFASLTRRYINKTLDGVNIYALSGTHAVVLNGTYWDPDAGEIAVRIYGIMPPDSEDGLLFYERRYVQRAGDTDRRAEAVVRSVRFD